jgi:hypothetical protein
MMQPRTLTKSRFALANECPAKLNYTGNPDYANQKNEDSFLTALAEGGMQVGELAKCYFPQGHDIKSLEYETALEETQELLRQDHVVIFEAAIRYQNFFIRVDILEKKGNQIRLIEVKAKSFDGDAIEFITKKGYIDSKWKKYMEDVAFQKYVLENALQDCSIYAFLMLANKSVECTQEGLNQRFEIDRGPDGRTAIHRKGDTSLEGLGTPILTAVNVDELASKIHQNEAYAHNPEIPYDEKIHRWAEQYAKGSRINAPVGLHCFNCEFQSDVAYPKSGFKECWSNHFNWTEEEFQKPKITDIWDFRGKTKAFEDHGIVFMDELDESFFTDNKAPQGWGMSPNQRRWLQVEMAVNKEQGFYLDRDGMKDRLNSFIYPLHFIDFETSMSAIPFYKGQHPYEQVAFQFSHHVMHEDGKVEHYGQFIKLEKGQFPNFDFLRALKRELQNDEGTIFRYANHENTVLNQIEDQLIKKTFEEVPDKDELIRFIHSITHRKDLRRGERDMVDMLELVKGYYYDPTMGGSNSIKAVLPAVLNASEFIQERYGQTISSRNDEISSLNFGDDLIWVQKDDHGKIINPYKLLPPLFEDIKQDDAENFTTDESISDGGAAMIAFAKMQYMNISDHEREAIVKGLLRYCELDTLAMVMIYEFWKHEVGL